MRKLLDKEFHDIRLSFLSGLCFLAFWCLVIVIEWLTTESRPSLMDKAAIGILGYVWIFVTTLIVVPLTSDRNPRQASLVHTLPLSAAKILLAKLIVSFSGAGGFIVAALLTGGFMFVLTGQDSLTLHAVNLSEFLIFGWLLAGIVVFSLLGAALFRRTLTALLMALAFEMGFGVGFSVVKVMWVWTDPEPFWGRLVLLVGCTVIALAILLRECARKPLAVSRMLALLALMIGVVIMVANVEYHLAFYGEPDIDTAWLCALSPDGRKIVLQNEEKDPLFLYSVRDGNMKRLTERFEVMADWTTAISAISADSRWLLVDSYRGALGSSPDAWNRNSISRNHRSRDNPYLTENDVRLWGEVRMADVFLLDLETGRRHLFQMSGGENKHLGYYQWNPRDDLLAVHYRGREQSGYGVFRSDGSALWTEEYPKNDPENRLLRFSQDGRFLYKIIFRRAGDDDLDIDLHLGQVSQPEWVPFGDWPTFTNNSPAGNHVFVARKVPELNQYGLLLQSGDGKTRVLGNLGIHLPFSIWSPSGNILLFIRDDRGGGYEAGLWNNRTMCYERLPDELSPILNKRMTTPLTWKLLFNINLVFENSVRFSVHFSPGERFIVMQDPDGERLLVYDCIEKKVESLAATWALGWLDESHLLIFDKRHRVYDASANVFTTLERYGTQSRGGNNDAVE